MQLTRYTLRCLLRMSGFGTPGKHEPADAFDNQVDADAKADEPHSRDRPRVPQHQPEDEGDGATDGNPSPVWEAVPDRRDDAEESDTKEQSCEQKRQGERGGNRVPIGQDA